MLTSYERGLVVGSKHGMEMTNQFFEKPILNSPYEYPGRHWELDGTGQPTQQIVETRRRAEFITPIPKAKKGGIACWFIDTDYNEESFFVRHAYFLGANDPYKALKTTLKAEIDADAWASLNSDTSRPFDRPKNGHIAVKVINHLGDEVMKVFRVE